MHTFEEIEKSQEAISQATTDLEKAFNRFRFLKSRLHELASVLRILDEGIHSQLLELARADHWCKLYHHDPKWEGELGKSFEDRSQACQNDWSKRCQRRTNAVETLTEVARALLEIEEAGPEDDPDADIPIS